MRILRPDRYFVSVLDIEPQILIDDGIKAVVLDLDNTILPRTVHSIPDVLVAWIASLTGAGLDVCFLSNNWHARVVEAADQAGIALIGKAVKPLPHGFFIARHRLASKRATTVMIGDQTFTDVLGAHLSGMRAFLVTPLVVQDLWHTKLLRKLDRFFLRGMQPVGGPSPVIIDETDKALL